MGLLDKAQELKAQEREEQDKKHQAELAQIKADRDFVVQVRAEVMKLLSREIDGKCGFKVEPENGIYGQVAKITHAKDDRESLVGYVCVARESYKFRGSDESPEEECSHVVMRLRFNFHRHSYHDSSPDLAYASASSSYNLEQEIGKFSDSLAEHLKKYF